MKKSPKKSVRKVKARPIRIDSSWFWRVDPASQAEYIGVRQGKVSYTKELRNGLLIDLDSHGNILGIEILSSYHLKKGKRV